MKLVESRFYEWPVEELTHSVIPYESPHNAYLSLFDEEIALGETLVNELGFVVE